VTDDATTYLDECMDTRVAEILRRRRRLAFVARDVAMQGTVDEGQLQYAASRDLVLLSHNRRDFQRLHRRYVERGMEHGGILIVPVGDAERVTVRAAMLLDWLMITGGRRSRLATWGHLQFQLTQGLRMAGYTDADHRLALGQGDERTPLG
jgi:hypothetical protein